MSTYGGDDLPRPIYPGQEEQPQYPPSPPTQPPTQPSWQAPPPPQPPSGEWPQSPYQPLGGPPPPGGRKPIPQWIWPVAALGAIAVIVIVVLLLTRGGDETVEPTTTTTDRPTTTTDDPTTTTDDTTTTTDDTTTSVTDQTAEEAAAQSLVGDAGNQSEFDCLVLQMEDQPGLVTALSSDSESYDLSTTDADAAASSVAYCFSYSSMVDVYENLLLSTDAFSTSEISCITGELALWDYATLTDLLALNYGLPATEDELITSEGEIFGYCYE